MNVGVIGAGPSGLCVIKELLEEGHTVTCFEKNDAPGGVFHYSATPEKGGVYDSTILTISNYFMAFSSFPPRDDEGRYQWTRSQYADYLRQFCEKFGLTDKIRLRTEVRRVDTNATGGYDLTIVTRDGVEEKHAFDAIAICTGTHQIPNEIRIPGSERFKGEIVHSGSYKNASRFRGKDVLCVGMGESGADITHEIALVANKTMLSLRHYPTITTRYINGHANDARTSRIHHAIPTRYLNRILTWKRKRVADRLSRKPMLTPAEKETLIHAQWSMKNPGIYNQFFTKSDFFITDIVENRLETNFSGIRELNEEEVIFNDGAKFRANAVMLNTGYRDEFKFIEHLVKFNTVRDLFKHMIHPDLGSKVAFIGWARPATGGVPPASEIQCRYFALLCSGKVKLPPRAELLETIRADKASERERFRVTPNIHTLVWWGVYMDSMARLIGCMPRLWSWNIPFSLKLIFGSLTSFQYRLRGPNATPEVAKRVIQKLPLGFSFGELASYSALLVLLKLGILKSSPAPEAEIALPELTT